jgi:predicted transcriptional regulator YheO
VLLQSFVPIADAIVLALKPYVEVVIHDLSSGTVYYIANGISRRRPGDSSLTELQDVVSFDQAVIGPYPKINWDGRRLKSISAVLNDGAGQPLGLFCINVDLSLFETLQAISSDFLRFADNTPKPSVLFQNDWRETVNDIVGRFVTDHGTTLAALPMSERTELIAILDTHKLFDVRHAASYIAQLTGVSRATLYKALKAARAQRPASN